MKIAIDEYKIKYLYNIVNYLPVHLKIFKTKYVQHADRAPGITLGLINCVVYLTDDMYKQPPVNSLDERISHVNRLIPRQRRNLEFITQN